MDIQEILNDSRQFLALTTLKTSEFEELLVPFSHRWEKYIKHFTLRGKRRAKPLTALQILSATDKLPTDGEKLFFILYFFKNNHLQQSLAAQYAMSQGQVSRWIKALLPVLSQSIVDLHLQAARTMGELVRLFRLRQRKDNAGKASAAQGLHLDATERPIGRNHDYEAQKHDYSGKQCCHTMKNSIAADESQFIHFAGHTYRGAVHDKKMAAADLPDLTALQNFELWFSKDKAYQSYRPKGVHLLEPFKAKRNNPLTDFQKAFNRWVSSIRIVCEHAIGGAKRCRVIKEVLRYFDNAFRDEIFAVACGLHNLRVTRRKTYACSAQRTRARINLNFSQT